MKKRFCRQLILFLVTVCVHNFKAGAQEENPLNRKGLDKLYAKDYSGAVEVFTDLIAADPKDRIGYLNRATAYVMLQEYEKALADLNQSISIYDGDKVAHITIGYILLQKKEYRQAITEFNLVIGSVGDQHGSVHKGRGDCLHALGYTDKACNDWRMAQSKVNKEVAESIAKYCK